MSSVPGVVTLGGISQKMVNWEWGSIPLHRCRWIFSRLPRIFEQCASRIIRLYAARTCLYHLSHCDRRKPVRVPERTWWTTSNWPVSISICTIPLWQVSTEWSAANTSPSCAPTRACPTPKAMSYEYRSASQLPPIPITPTRSRILAISCGVSLFLALNKNSSKAAIASSIFPSNWVCKNA